MKNLKLFNLLFERNVFYGFNETQLSEDYPNDFNLEKFKEINSYRQKLQYAKSFLGKPLGSGSSRVVFRIDENKVLKIAKNKKGILQNEAEINWSGEHFYSDIIAKVIDYDRENSYWVEMELAFKVKKVDFEKLWNIDFNSIAKYLTNIYEEDRSKPKLYYIPKEIEIKLKNNDIIDHIISFMHDSDLSAGDLGRMSSWGKVKRNGSEYLVLVDFGLTNEVYSTYY